MTEQMDILRLKVEGWVRQSDHRIITKVTKGEEVCGRYFTTLCIHASKF
jgi:hypothetical protein